MQKKNINLLEKRGAPPTFWQRLYAWVTKTCRGIVIFVELLVLIAFGWRFWLDRKLNDLKEDVELKGDVLASLSEEESEIRTLQSRLTTYESLWDGSSNLSPLIQEINAYLPSDIEELIIAITETTDGRSLSISGQLNRSDISVLENRLKDSESVSDVALKNIEKKSEGDDLYSFSLSAEIILNVKRNSFSEGAESTSS